MNANSPPFVVSAHLNELFATRGILKGKKGNEARELYQGIVLIPSCLARNANTRYLYSYTEQAMNFDPLRDLSPFGRCCFLGNLKGVKEVKGPLLSHHLPTNLPEVL